MSEAEFADLHLHTLFSDGTYTPEELILEVSRAGLAAISVTDHDTVSGIDSVWALAEARGVEVIPGVELTVEYQAQEVHILGYLVDYKNKKFIARLDSLQQDRIQRIYKILDRLKKFTGLELKPSCVFKLAKEAVVGRLHIARAMVDACIVSSVREAFQKYIGDKCPAYIAGFKFSPQEAIDLVKQVGGIPVLAHPHSLNSAELVTELIELGIMGLEVYYPEHTPAMVRHYLELAEKFNLLVTGGSDCHGLAKPEIKIGSVKIPYTLVQKLKKFPGAPGR